MAGAGGTDTVLAMHPVRWFRQHPQAADAALAFALIAAGLPALWVSGVVDGVDRRDPDVLGVVLVVGMALPLIWRRRAPRTVLAICTAFVFTAGALEYNDTPAGLAMLVALYSVTAHLATRPAWTAGGLTLVAFTIWLSLGVALGRGDVTVTTFLGNYGLALAALLTGEVVRRRQERMAELEERARQLERERELVAAGAVQRERVRIARELHDVVAHSVTVIVVQAGAGRRIAAAEPDTAVGVFGAIEQTGREALDELRRLVGVLREEDLADGPELSPRPSLSHVEELVKADAQLPVSLRIDGDPVEVPPSVEVSAYRIVQEALTNVRKHAGPAQATVVLCYQEEALEVEVADDGRGASIAFSGDGHGLLGMRERAALCGGEVKTGPRRGGGWIVHARLPYRAETVRVERVDVA